MVLLDKLERTLVDALDKKAPYKMPANARKGLAGALWIITLVLGILQLWGAWKLWNLGHNLDRAAERAAEYFNSLATYYGAPLEDAGVGVFYYLSVIFLVGVAILMLVASPGLKAFKKQGWNLLFYGLILNVVYGFVRMFSDVGGGLLQFVWTVIVTTVAAYFLFQVRDQFTGKASAEEHHVTHEHKSSHKK